MKFRNFVDRCNGLAFRHWIRLLFEFILFFTIPVIVSAFFYVKIIFTLAKRNKQVGRNNVLTLAFALSWLFWVICWFPNVFVIAQKNYKDTLHHRWKDYAGSMYDYGNYYNEYDFYEYDYEKYSFSQDNYNTNDYYKNDYYGNDYYNYDYVDGVYSAVDRYEFVISYARLFRIPFQLFYSHLNPLLYLMVLKKYQQHHKKILLRLFHLTLSTKRDVQIKGSHSQHILLQLGFQISKVFKSLVACVLMILLGLLLSASIYHGLGVLQSVLHKQRVVIVETHRINTQRQLCSLRMNKPIQSYCADHNGIFNVDYRRCFLLSTHLPSYLNFTTHLKYCEQEGTTMCYPRSYEEMRFMYNMLAKWAPDNLEPRLPWRLVNEEASFIFQDGSFNQSHLDYIAKYPLVHYHIHVGFVKKAENLFTSVDGQFNISSRTHSWFQSKYSKRPYFVGPSVCLSSSLTTLWECTPSWSTPETFCCKDFFYKTTLRSPTGK